jgi:hypothetical protein
VFSPAIFFYAGLFNCYVIAVFQKHIHQPCLLSSPFPSLRGQALGCIVFNWKLVNDPSLRRKVLALLKQSHCAARNTPLHNFEPVLKKRRCCACSHGFLRITIKPAGRQAATYAAGMYRCAIPNAHTRYNGLVNSLYGCVSDNYRTSPAWEKVIIVQ